jgi:enoyl-CoA hydratase/carnithine racemase
VSYVVPADQLMADARKLADRIAMQPPHALRIAKSLLRRGQEASYDVMMELSAASQGLSHWTEDHLEGVDALLEKRTPVFKGR